MCTDTDSSFSVINNSVLNDSVDRVDGDRTCLGHLIPGVGHVQGGSSKNLIVLGNFRFRCTLLNTSDC